MDATVWRAALGAQLQRLAQLPPGWNSYGARPPTAAALRAAWVVLSALAAHGAPAPTLTPSPAGALDCEWPAAPHPVLLRLTPDASRRAGWRTPAGPRFMVRGGAVLPWLAAHLARRKAAP